MLAKVQLQRTSKLIVDYNLPESKKNLIYTFNLYKTELETSGGQSTASKGWKLKGKLYEVIFLLA